MPEMAAINRRALEPGQRRTLITPEGVDLQLSLASVGQRAAAFTLDLIIMAVALIVLTILCLIGAGAMGSAAGNSGIEVAGIVWLLGFFLLRNFYFALMEMGPRAATYGKRATGLRVVARSGERLTADRVIARNMIREIEFFLPLTFLFSGAAGGGWTALAGIVWTGIFLLFPFFNKDRLRVGDLLAGTWVVMVPKRKLSVDSLSSETKPVGYTFTEAQLDVYGIYELQTLEQVLRDDNYEAIGTVAATIRAKIGYPHDGFDRDFLVSYYDAVRVRMERNLLFGKRREDKFDRTALRLKRDAAPPEQ